MFGRRKVFFLISFPRGWREVHPGLSAGVGGDFIKHVRWSDELPREGEWVAVTRGIRLKVQNVIWQKERIYLDFGIAEDHEFITEENLKRLKWHEGPTALRDNDIPTTLSQSGCIELAPMAFWGPEANL